MGHAGRYCVAGGVSGFAGVGLHYRAGDLRGWGVAVYVLIFFQGSWPGSLVEVVPQGLRPLRFCGFYVRAKARTLQTAIAEIHRFAPESNSKMKIGAHSDERAAISARSARQSSLWLPTLSPEKRRKDGARKILGIAEENGSILSSAA